MVLLCYLCFKQDSYFSSHTNKGVQLKDRELKLKVQMLAVYKLIIKVDVLIRQFSPAGFRNV